jgi:hypothetical protein
VCRAGRQESRRRHKHRHAPQTPIWVISERQIVDSGGFSGCWLASCDLSIKGTVYRKFDPIAHVHISQKPQIIFVLTNRKNEATDVVKPHSSASSVLVTAAAAWQSPKSTLVEGSPRRVPCSRRRGRSAAQAPALIQTFRCTRSRSSVARAGVGLHYTCTCMCINVCASKCLYVILYVCMCVCISS